MLGPRETVRPPFRPCFGDRVRPGAPKRSGSTSGPTARVCRAEGSPGGLVWSRPWRRGLPDACQHGGPRRGGAAGGCSRLAGDRPVAAGTDSWHTGPVPGTNYTQESDVQRSCSASRRTVQDGLGRQSSKTQFGSDGDRILSGQRTRRRVRGVRVRTPLCGCGPGMDNGSTGERDDRRSGRATRRTGTGIASRVATIPLPAPVAQDSKGHSHGRQIPSPEHPREPDS
jgi:hypothetical protein